MENIIIGIIAIFGSGIVIWVLGLLTGIDRGKAIGWREATDYMKELKLNSKKE